MLRYFFPAIVCVLAVYVGVGAQSVVIRPKKTVYIRPRPMMDFKKRFTVTYPKVKAATPALSKKIESTISYLKVLQLNIREELTDVQWLEEADYKVDYNARGILVITLSMNGTGAYPDGTSKTVAVNLKTGNRITPAEAFTNIDGIVGLIRKKQKSEIDAAIVELRKDPNANETDPAQLFAEEQFTAEDLKHFAIDNKGVMFIYDYGFPHVIEALEPEGRYKFTWSEIATYVKPSGPLAQFISK
jgi:hypothetical protein